MYNVHLLLQRAHALIEWEVSGSCPFRQPSTIQQQHVVLFFLCLFLVYRTHENQSIIFYFREWNLPMSTHYQQTILSNPFWRYHTLTSSIEPQAPNICWHGRHHHHGGGGRWWLNVVWCLLFETEFRLIISKCTWHTYTQHATILNFSHPLKDFPSNSPDYISKIHMISLRPRDDDQKASSHIIVTVHMCCCVDEKPKPTDIYLHIILEPSSTAVIVVAPSLHIIRSHPNDVFDLYFCFFFLFTSSIFTIFIKLIFVVVDASIVAKRSHSQSTKHRPPLWNHLE